MNMLHTVILLISLLSPYLVQATDSSLLFQQAYGELYQPCDSLVEKSEVLGLAPFLRHENPEIREAAKYKQAIIHSCHYDLEQAVSIHETLNLSLLESFFEAPTNYFKYKAAASLLDLETSSTKNYTLACKKMEQVYLNSREETYSKVYFKSDLLLILYCHTGEDNFSEQVRNLIRLKREIKLHGDQKIQMDILNEIGIFYAKHSLPELAAEQFCYAADVALNANDDRAIDYQFNCVLELLEVGEFDNAQYYLSLIKNTPRSNAAQTRFILKTWQYLTIKTLFFQKKHSELFTFMEAMKGEVSSIESEQRFFWAAKLEACLQLGNTTCARAAFLSHPYIKENVQPEYAQDAFSSKTLAKHLSLQGEHEKANAFYARESELLNEFTKKTRNSVMISGFAKLNNDLLQLEFENIKSNLKVSRYSILFLTLLLVISGVIIISTWLLKRRFKILSETDSLTNTFNHIASIHAISAAMRKKYFESIAVAILDIDHFKRINDEYGHPFGDRVIKNTINIVRQEVRKTDIVGRLGGEEFIVALKNISSDQAARIFERIRKKVEESQLIKEGHSVSVTVSLGFGYVTNPTLTVEEIYKKIDQRLYDAKKQGRNRVLKA